MCSAGSSWPVVGSKNSEPRYRLPATGYRLSATGYRLALALAIAVVGAGCGKKGPPLAPVVRVPGPVATIAVRRLGSDAYVTLTIPAANIDATMPADVARVEVYGYTGRSAPGARFLEGATLVATIPVAPIARDAAGRPLPPVAPTADAVQGSAVTVRDTLAGDSLEPRVLPPPPARRGAPPPPRRGAPAPVTGPPAPPGPVQRFYMAIGFSDRERTGPQGQVASVPLIGLPAPPAGLIGAYTPESVQLTWEPSGGLLGFILDRELAPEDPVAEDALPVAPIAPLAPIAPVTDLPPGPTLYNVYREMAPDPLLLPSGPRPADWRASLPLPLNPLPLASLTLADLIAVDGRERCYQVRAVRGFGAAAVEGDPSPRVCFTPVDTVPPETPTGLVAETADGAINLIWDPNIEEDLAGYLILRGAAGDATLTALTAAPVATARYVDRAVMPGTRYVYAVVAIDNRVPLGNVSAESNRVEETAR